jgi:hypothetical protein
MRRHSSLRSFRRAPANVDAVDADTGRDARSSIQRHEDNCEENGGHSADDQ